MDENVCEVCEAENCMCCSDCDNYPCRCCETCGYVDCECCSECGEYPCECCSECGMTTYSCECCSKCGYSPCSCEETSGHMGVSERPPWVERGHKPVSCIVNSTNWEKTWPEIDREFDPVEQAANFYLLEAIANDIPCGIPNSKRVAALFPNDEERDHELLKSMGVTKKADRIARIKERNEAIADRRIEDPTYDLAWIVGEAERMLAEVVDRSDRTLVGYFHMACAGEARHHRAIGGTVLAGGERRTQAWIGWRKVFETVGPESIKDLAALLGEISGGTYGGKRWKQAADILYERVTGTLGPDEESNKRLFVDRAWTLEHNGGCFLNKIRWKVNNRKGWNLSYLKSAVLEAHAANPPQWRVLFRVASDDVIALADRYWDVANRRRSLFGLDAIEHPMKDMPVRTVCLRCSSNPKLGHMAHCSAAQHDDWNDGDTTKQASWFATLEEDEWSNCNWSKWTDKQEIADKLYLMKPDGTVVLRDDMQVSVTAYACVEIDGGHYREVSTVENMKLSKAMKYKFVPADLHKSWFDMFKLDKSKNATKVSVVAVQIHVNYLPAEYKKPTKVSAVPLLRLSHNFINKQHKNAWTGINTSQVTNDILVDVLTQGFSGEQFFDAGFSKLVIEKTPKKKPQPKKKSTKIGPAPKIIPIPAGNGMIHGYSLSPTTHSNHVYVSSSSQKGV